ncbi:MAG TPA: glutathione S-transferase N-terminal domain-containing protein [Gammaproteobacteria bacterium]|nr:glutathione S-transferase N-terminal domain-containing protein [Gammaproteobacteria bacterium]
MLKLYYSPGACSLAPHILLEESGLPYDAEQVTIAEGKQRTPEYLAINPKGRVPALLTEEGEVLTEVPAISWYIADAATSVRLLPQGRLPAARSFEWFNWLSGTVHTMAFGQYWRMQRFVADEQLFPPVKEKGWENIRDNFAYIEKRLAGRSWAVGNAYTAVDAYLLVFFRWGNRIGMDMRAAYPGWTAQAQRVLERPAVRRVIMKEGIDIWDRAA